MVRSEGRECATLRTHGEKYKPDPQRFFLTYARRVGQALTMETDIGI